MSHVVTVKTRMDDLSAVRAACKTLGWEFLEGQQTYNWYGSWVGDTAIPEHLFTPAEVARLKGLADHERIKEMTKLLRGCEHAIRVPGATYEIGLRKAPSGRGFVPVWDYYMVGRLPKTAGAQLCQAYAVEKVKAEVKRRGGRVEGVKVQEDGSVQIRVAASGWRG